MVTYDGAETCELVGLYILNKIECILKTKKLWLLLRWRPSCNMVHPHKKTNALTLSWLLRSFPTGYCIFTTNYPYYIYIFLFFPFDVVRSFLSSFFSFLHSFLFFFLFFSSFSFSFFFFLVSTKGGQAGWAPLGSTHGRGNDRRLTQNSSGNWKNKGPNSSGPSSTELLLIILQPKDACNLCPI